MLTGATQWQLKNSLRWFGGTDAIVGAVMEQHASGG